MKNLITDLKNKKLIIDGDKIYVRILEEVDATQKYCDWLNDPEVNKYLDVKKATIDSLKEYIKEKYENPGALFFGIFVKVNNEHIGNVKLEHIDFAQMRAEFSFLIGEKKYWGKGYGSLITNFIVDWAFDVLNLNEVYLGVIAENIGAVKVYEKAGFKIDSIEKNLKMYNDVFYDVYKMSVKK